jgi:hypothetical protein
MSMYRQNSGDATEDAKAIVGDCIGHLEALTPEDIERVDGPALARLLNMAMWTRDHIVAHLGEEQAAQLLREEGVRRLAQAEEMGRLLESRQTAPARPL